MEQKDEEGLSLELIDAGRELLSSPDLSVRHNSYDHDLSTIANICLRGSEGATATQSLCEHIQQAISNHVFRVYDYDQLLSVIFELQPRIALDVFFGRQLQSDSSAGSLLDVDGFSLHQRNPLGKASIEEVIQWCDDNPAERYAIIASIAPYQTAAGDRGVTWTPLALEIFKRAPDAVAILKIFVARFSPRSWSGSLAAIIESRLGLLDNLGEVNNPSLERYIAEVRPELLNRIAQTRRWEDDHDSARDERFE